MSPGPAIQLDALGGKQLAATAAVTVGRHRFAFSDDEWSRVGTLGPSPIIAFSRTPIEATFGMGAPTVLTGAVAATPPAGESYVRSPRARVDHAVVWCALNEPGALAAIVGRHSPRAADHPARPFASAATRASPLHAFTLHRLAARIFDQRGAEPLEIEEAVLTIAEDIARDAAGFRPRSAPGGGATEARRRDAVNAACATIAVRFAEPLSIGDIAAGSGYSPAFLARCFRETTGRTMHDYLTATRLREALDLIQTGGITLTRAALLTGFSSHAHLTATFVKHFGRPPSAIVFG